MNRRQFLRGVTIGTALSAAIAACASEGVRPRILLRNGWQSQNIGDISHYIGMFELMERYGVTDLADVVLWPVNVQNGADALIADNFPWVTVTTDRASREKALAECNFMIHGSATRLSAATDVEHWLATGKPVGIFGISLNRADPEVIATLNRAQFVFFRDTPSLRLATDNGCAPPIVELGLDTAFGMTTTRNSAAAGDFMTRNHLDPGRFLCVIPRYRRTPTWELPGRENSFNADAQAYNESMLEQDHLPLREAISAIVRETGMSILVTHEDQTQITLGKRILIDPLPADVKSKVVWRSTYWLPDEALAVYAQSAGLFGNEMHSPILCVANGVPAVVCRFKEQGTKSVMWSDIGLGDWLFDLDSPHDVARIVPTVLGIARDPMAARARADEARNVVHSIQDENFRVLRDSLRALPTTAPPTGV